MDLYQEYKTQKKLLLEAIVEKDYLEIYEFISLKNDFVLKLGEPRYELHKIELAIARTKLKLDMMQTSTKFKTSMNTENIDKQLNKEFEKHDSMLKNMKKEIENVHRLKEENSIIEPENAEELKTLYSNILSFVHPELNNKLDKASDKIWKSAKKAYAQRDASKMKKLLKKLQKEYSNKETLQNYESSEEGLEETVLSLKLKREAIMSEIESIKKQFPFNEAKILGDEAAVIKFKKDIKADIKVANEVLDKLEKQLLEKMPPQGKYLH